ncbi:Predicted membrane protein [[Actinobacillus] rossii]|uniref:Predicted membrane protein n=1 Tax=[Actinobacillus] rossii TaxID=123820 RepID=A0A380TPE4_9PAST|nr:Predicted membrane protein [[Actinobacillus] rossii]
MLIIAYILIILVALEHFYIMYLEMFALNSPKARQIFNLDEQTATNPKIQLLFANQGLYNGFLAAGIIFSLCIQQSPVTYFFLICVIVAAVYGALSSKNRGILIKQGMPAVLALVANFVA